MRKKYMFEHLPQPTEYDIPEVKLTMAVAPEIHERLKAEFGSMLFGSDYNTLTQENANMTAREAGHFGGSFRKFKQIRFNMTAEGMRNLEETLRVRGCI